MSNYFYHRIISFRRLLFDSCDHNIPRHCEIPTDHNVFDHYHSNVSMRYPLDESSIDDPNSTNISSVFLNNENTTLICNSDNNGNFSRSNVDVTVSSIDGSHSLENITLLERSKENIFRMKEDEKEELSVKYVSFQYQIQTSVIQTSSKLNDNGTLLTIEKRMSDLLVAYIFGDGDRCFGLQRNNNNETTTSIPIITSTINDYNGHRRFRKLQQNGQQNFQSNISQESYNNKNHSLQETIIGISAFPNDVILPGLEGVRCRTNLKPNADRCYIIDGSFTLIGYGSNLDWAEAYTKLIIKNGMETGILNNVHKEIFSIDFISFNPFNNNLSSTLVNNSSTPQNDDISIQDTSSKPVYNTNNDDKSALPWIIVALGTSVILLSYIGFRRRRHNQYVQMKRTQQEIGGDRYHNTQQQQQPNTAWSQILPPISPIPICYNNNDSTKQHQDRYSVVNAENYSEMDANDSIEDFLMIVVDNNDIISPLHSNSYSTTNTSVQSSSQLNENEKLDPVVMASNSGIEFGYDNNNNSSDHSSSLYFEDESEDSRSHQQDFRENSKHSYRKLGNL